VRMPANSEVCCDVPNVIARCLEERNWLRGLSIFGLVAQPARVGDCTLAEERALRLQFDEGACRGWLSVDGPGRREDESLVLRIPQRRTDCGNVGTRLEDLDRRPAILASHVNALWAMLKADGIAIP